MRTSRRYQIRLPEPLASALEAFAMARGLGAGPAIRAVLGQGLERGTDTEACRDCAAGLAALIAAEQTLLLVAAILPNGRALVEGLAAEAAVAAEKRLAITAPALEDLD